MYQSRNFTHFAKLRIAEPNVNKMVYNSIYEISVVYVCISPILILIVLKMIPIKYQDQYGLLISPVLSYETVLSPINRLEIIHNMFVRKGHVIEDYVILIPCYEYDIVVITRVRVLTTMISYE